MPKLNEPVFKNPLDNPSAANAEITRALDSASSAGDRPVIEFPPSDLVELPGGYVSEDGKISRSARVRELTGEDEETMARAVMSNNPIHFINTILECGVTEIGDDPAPARVKDIVTNKLLSGDKEQLFVGVRIATYGNEVQIKDWQCPNCSAASELVIHLDGPEQDVEVKKLGDPVTDGVFEVPLRKGGRASVRLMTGADQNLLWDKDQKFTRAQMDTKLLSLCIETITDAAGNRMAVAAVPQMARQLGLMDRKRILKELMDRQPGPRLNDIKFNCNACGEQVSLAIGLEELFLNFELL